MAELKTKVTGASVSKFIRSIRDQNEKHDCETLIRIMKRISKEDPRMWGTSIVGFGSYHYHYDSGREGDWFRIGFSPRKNAISIYVNAGFKEMEAELKGLGKHKTGQCCLYIKKLSDVDQTQLTKILSVGFRKNYEH